MFQPSFYRANGLNRVFRAVQIMVFSGAAFALTGCSTFNIERFKMPSLTAGTGPEQAQRLQVTASESALIEATNVVDAFYQLPYDLALSPGKKASYDHVAGLPVMYIDGHRTFVKGMQVSGQGDLNSLVIKSRIWKAAGGSWRKSQAGVVLFPSVLFLSDQFQPLAEIKRPAFNYVPGSVIRDGRGALTQGMSVSINVPEPAQRATYIVFYVSPENRQGVFHFCEGGQGMVRFNSSARPVYEGVPCSAISFGMEGAVDVLIQ